MAKSKIHKQLNAEIDELKLLGTNRDVPIVFILDETSINKEETFDVEEANERVIIGRIFPNSDIFKDGAFQIEIKLPPAYPFDPPKVRFLTPIYHPNVDKEGKFLHELLLKAARWTNNTSLVQIVKIMVNTIDKPDFNYSLNHEVATEYQKNRDQFNRKASEMIKNYALPRN